MPEATGMLTTATPAERLSGSGDTALRILQTTPGVLQRDRTLSKRHIKRLLNFPRPSTFRRPYLAMSMPSG